MVSAVRLSEAAPHEFPVALDEVVGGSRLDVTAGKNARASGRLFLASCHHKQ
jgi:hypothetical protein